LRSGQIKRQNLYFDLSGILVSKAPYEASRKDFNRMLTEQKQRDFPDWESPIEARIREIGIDRVLFGSDWPTGSPAADQLLVQEQLKLSPQELRRFFGNVAPYFE
jgi:predicted TIM-barrel fold metal-dependent hydrolase